MRGLQPQPVAGPHVERPAQILGEHHTPPGQHLGAHPVVERAEQRVPAARGEPVQQHPGARDDGEPARPSVTRAAPGSPASLSESPCGRTSVGKLSGGSALTHTSASATGAKMARADPIMSALVPVITTVVSTPINTVITVAHTRRGARRMVAAASAPHDPNTRDSADVAVTMGTVSAKPAASSATSTAPSSTPVGAPAGTARAATANSASAPTPLAARSHGGTASAADAPTGASASTGETLYTCRAAIAAAATAVSAVAASASGTA